MIQTEMQPDRVGALSASLSKAATAQQSAYDIAVHNHFEALSSLQGLLNDAQKRLAPMLQPAIPSDTEKAGTLDEPSEGAAIDRLKALTRDVYRAQGTVRDILARLVV